MHFRRALEVVEDPAQRVRILVELGRAAQYHHAGRDEAARLLDRGRRRWPGTLDDPVLLARVALTVHRARQVETAAARSTRRSWCARRTGG